MMQQVKSSRSGTTAANETKASTDARPRRSCDVVMKGGVTSGVVFPKALSRLAERYDFRSVGGTSAGAIAAAATAAAQYRRTVHGGEEGFERLANLPEEFGEQPGSRPQNRLLQLFQPAKSTTPVFNVLTTLTGPKAWGDKLAAIIYEYRVTSFIGTLPGVSLAIYRIAQVGDPDVWFFLSLLVMATGGALGAFGMFLWGLKAAVPANRFGLCSGMPGDQTGRGNAEALTPWLTNYLNDLAGLDSKQEPLTFGHLQRAGASPDEAINLRMMTTNLTHGRPYQLPFRQDDGLRENHLFYFRPDEFRELFPENVVRWMLDHPRTSDTAVEKKQSRRAKRRRFLAENGYEPLPNPDDLPVVVATRMSLSFPILLSAIPLHSIDRTKDEETGLPIRCWFSDGGISSNFPLHFFDAPLPRRPTFSFDLTAKPAGTPEAELQPTMDRSNQPYLASDWTPIDTTPGFVIAIIKTMQNWTDTTLSKLPGYRDRIVRVPLTPDEGGLNLDMPEERINKLAHRGVLAAEELIRHFDVPSVNEVMNWDNHRWLRFRTAMASLEQLLTRLDDACDHPENEDTNYLAWLREMKDIPSERVEAPSYPLSQTQLRAAVKSLNALRTAFTHWPEKSPAQNRAPRPQAVLQPRPQI
jgi:predicted acylesterase/phospholipase RssA